MATLEEVIKRTLFDRPCVIGDEEITLRRDPGRPGTALEQITFDLMVSLQKQEELAEKASILWMEQEEDGPDDG